MHPFSVFSVFAIASFLLLVHNILFYAGVHKAALELLFGALQEKMGKFQFIREIWNLANHSAIKHHFSASIFFEKSLRTVK